MKGSKSLVAIAIAFSLAISPSAIAAGKTSTKAAGRTGTTVVNTILSGAGIPTKTIGIDGDFYIDTKNANLYGPKAKGMWKISTSLKAVETKSVVTVTGDQGVASASGPQGYKGDKGATGATGDKGTTGDKGAMGLAGASGSTGATGSTGFTGATGAVGSIGATGAVGATGPAGTAGAKGDTGTAGISGTAGAAGADGAAGQRGDTGLTGATGPAGATGATGTTGLTGTSGTNGSNGAAGISVSYFLDLGNWTLSTATNLGSSESTLFGNLASGSYTFEILVDGIFSPNSFTAMNIGMQLISSSGTLDYRVFSSDSTAFINGSGTRHFQFLIIGKVVCTETTTLKLKAIDQYGATSGNALNFSGRALINKVGSIG